MSWNELSDWGRSSRRDTERERERELRESSPRIVRSRQGKAVQCSAGGRQGASNSNPCSCQIADSSTIPKD